MGAKPIIYDPKAKGLSEFKKEHKVARVIDTYLEQLEDLFLIRNPRFKFDKNYQKDFESFLEEQKKGEKLENLGTWFYFPWSQSLVHYLSDEMHQELRTARNKNIIKKDEQEKFYNFSVGIAGLSVGSNAALTIAMMGGARVIKLADPDLISGSNLNRIREDFTSVGMNKCLLVAQKIYQINPYAEIFTYPNGIGEETLAEFLAGPPKIDVLVEEMDNLGLKIRIRVEARKHGIPVIMATDNGDGIIMDIERYDLDPELKIFNGVAGDLSFEEFKGIPPQEMPRLSTKIAGKDLVAPRMHESLLEVGKTLYSWPQLGDAATLSGVGVAYVVKRLALGEKLRTGKMEVNLDAIFDPEYNSSEQKEGRDKDRKEFLKIIGLGNS